MVQQTDCDFDSAVAELLLDELRDERRLLWDIEERRIVARRLGVKPCELERAARRLVAQGRARFEVSGRGIDLVAVEATVAAE